jgi:hypothetical protein
VFQGFKTHVENLLPDSLSGRKESRMKKLSTLLALVASLLVVFSVAGGAIYLGWNYIVKPDLVELRNDLPKMKAELAKTAADLKAMPLRESVPLVVGSGTGMSFMVYDLFLKNRLFDSSEDPAKVKARLPFNFKCLKWGAASLVLAIPFSFSSWTVSVAILLFSVGLYVTVSSVICLAMTPVRLVTGRMFRALESRFPRTRE